MKWTWMEKELEKCLLAFEMIIDRNEKTDWESLPNEPRILILFSGGGFRFSRSSANCWEIHKKKKKKVESTSSMSSFFLGLLSPPSQCLIKPMRRDETCVSTLLLAFSLFLQQIRDFWPPTRRPFLFFPFYKSLAALSGRMRRTYYYRDVRVLLLVCNCNWTTCFMWYNVWLLLVSAAYSLIHSNSSWFYSRFNSGPL